ncbi:MAG TPA: hypothetical protein VGK73_04935 [Polyangiaceae bacterium]
MKSAPGSRSSSLSPSVEALLAEERVVPPQAEEVRARLLSRAQEAVKLGAPAPPATRAGVSRRFLTAAAGVAAVAGIAAAFELSGGADTGLPADTPAVTQSSSAPSRPVPAAVSGSAAPLGAAPAPAPRGEPAPAPTTSSTPPAAREVAPSAGPSSATNRGIEELELLSRARQADARSDYTTVLNVLTAHERSFPAGRLSEEREVLRVKALVALGRGEQARRAAARFRRQFPRSVLLRKVDGMLASLP